MIREEKRRKEERRRSVWHVFKVSDTSGLPDHYIIMKNRR